MKYPDPHHVRILTQSHDGPSAGRQPGHDIEIPRVVLIDGVPVCQTEHSKVTIDLSGRQVVTIEVLADRVSYGDIGEMES